MATSSFSAVGRGFRIVLGDQIRKPCSRRPEPWDHGLRFEWNQVQSGRTPSEADLRPTQPRGDYRYGKEQHRLLRSAKRNVQAGRGFCSERPESTRRTGSRLPSSGFGFHRSKGIAPCRKVATDHCPQRPGRRRLRAEASWTSWNVIVRPHFAGSKDTQRGDTSTSIYPRAGRMISTGGYWVTCVHKATNGGCWSYPKGPSQPGCGLWMRTSGVGFSVLPLVGLTRTETHALPPKTGKVGRMSNRGRPATCWQT